MNNGDYELVVFDLDSTLVDGEGIDTLAREAGVEDEVAEVTERAMKGELDFGDSLRERVSKLEGLSVERAEDALQSLPLVRNAEDVVNRIKVEKAVFSGGFYPAAEPVAERLDARHVRANQLGRRNGELSGDVDGELVDDTKGEVLRELASELDVETSQVIAVGDGSNDVSMFEEAGFAIGLDPKPVAREAADVSVDRKDFRLIEPVLEERSVIE